ncbi:LysE family translocator [Alteribacter lacisalsi]
MVLGLSIAAPIGPINIEIIRRGIYHGFWPSLLVGAGGMSADLLLMFLMYQGLSTVLTLGGVQLCLMILGAVILTWTGISGLMNNPDIPSPQEEDFRMEKPEQENQSGTLLRSYATGASIAMFNPLNILFWLGIYGSVLSDTFSDENKLRAFIISSAVFLGVGLWNLNLAFTVHFGKRLLRPGAVRGVCYGASFILIGFGLYFAWKAVMKVGGML